MPKTLHSANYAVVRRQLTDLRGAAGRSQSEVAAALGRPQSFVSKYETGERRLDFTEVMDLLAVLGAEPHRFVADYLDRTAPNASKPRSVRAPSAPKRKRK